MTGRRLRRLLCAGAKSMHRERLGVRRDPHQAGARDDRARHAGAMGVRLVSQTNGIECFAQGVSELRMGAVDLRVDDGDQHALAGRDLVRLGEPQLVGDILFRLAGFGVGRGGVGGSAFACCRLGGRRLILIEHVDVVGLRDDLLGLHRAHDLGRGAAAADAELDQRSAGQSGLLGRDDREVVPARDLLDPLRRHVWAPLADHFGRDEARLVSRRHAGEVALAGQGADRQHAPRREQFGAMGDALHLPKLGRRRVDGAHARVAIGKAAAARTYRAARLRAGANVAEARVGGTGTRRLGVGQVRALRARRVAEAFGTRRNRAGLGIQSHRAGFGTQARRIRFGIQGRGTTLGVQAERCGALCIEGRRHSRFGIRPGRDPGLGIRKGRIDAGIVRQAVRSGQSPVRQRGGIWQASAWTSRKTGAHRHAGRTLDAGRPDDTFWHLRRCLAGWRFFQILELVQKAKIGDLRVARAARSKTDSRSDERGRQGGGNLSKPAIPD